MKHLVLLFAVGMFVVPSTSDARPSGRKRVGKTRKVKRSTAVAEGAGPTSRRRGPWSNPTVSTRKRGRSIRVTVKHRAGGSIVAVVPVPATCSAAHVGKAIEKEIRQNADAFWRESNTMISLPSLGLPGERRPGAGRSGDDGGGSSDDRGVKDSDPMAGFEATIGDVLATGKRKGRKGGGGETCFNGSNFDVGTLLSHNNDMSPAAGGVQKTEDGKAVITTENDDGSVTETVWGSDGKKLHTSTTKTLTGKGGTKSTVTVATDHTTHENTVTTSTKKGGKTTTNSVTSGPKGMSTTHSTSSGSGDSESGVSVTQKWDEKGKHKGGKIVVTKDGKDTTGTIAPDNSQDQKKGKSGDGGVKLTAEGSVSMPAFCISDEEIATLINWNKLQASITDPSPIADEEDQPNSAAKGAGPCGELEGESFDPNPAYLRPNKQGWVTDPPPTGGRSNRGRDG